MKKSSPAPEDLNTEAETRKAHGSVCRCPICIPCFHIAAVFRKPDAFQCRQIANILRPYRGTKHQPFDNGELKAVRWAAGGGLAGVCRFIGISDQGTEQELLKRLGRVEKREMSDQRPHAKSSPIPGTASSSIPSWPGQMREDPHAVGPRGGRYPGSGPCLWDRETLSDGGGRWNCLTCKNPLGFVIMPTMRSDARHRLQIRAKCHTCDVLMFRIKLGGL